MVGPTITLPHPFHTHGGVQHVISRLPSSRTGLLPWLDWRYSLLLPVGVLLALRDHWLGTPS